MRKNLKNARVKNGHTQKELADLVNISVRHYQRLEAGISIGNIEHWFKLKSILKCKTLDFLLEQEVIKNNK